MRNSIQDEIPVRSNQSREAHVAIVDAQIVAFANQALNHLDHRALAKIVCARLEAESEDPDALGAKFHHQLDAARNLYLVAGKNRVHDRKLEIVYLGLIGDGAQILRKTRTSECKSRLQVC